MKNLAELLESKDSVWRVVVGSGMCHNMLVEQQVLGVSVIKGRDGPSICNVGIQNTRNGWGRILSVTDNRRIIAVESLPEPGMSHLPSEAELYSWFDRDGDAWSFSTGTVLGRDGDTLTMMGPAIRNGAVVYGADVLDWIAENHRP